MKKIIAFVLLLVSFAAISTAQNTNCNAEFNVSYINGNTVQLNPVMVGSPANTEHFWYFGDGNSSTAVSPVHTYPNGSVFTAVHTIVLHNSAGVVVCMDSAFRVIQVQNSCNLVANFYSYVDSMAAIPNTYHFVNTSTPLHNSDSIRWTFGDGTSSSQVNPNHTYAQPGTYNVCLRIQKRDSIGNLLNCVREICHTVYVPSACNLVAAFYSYHDTTVANLLTYHFENTSTPLSTTDSIRWTFGDGTSSNQVSPNHTYSQPGTYTVCLRIQKRNSNGILTTCVREVCHTIIVLGPACNLVASFYSFRDTTVSSSLYTYHFINTSVPLSNTDSIRWTFGDGTSSNQVNPIHSYSQPGTYNICLRIQKRNTNGTLVNCIREICHTVAITGDCNLQAHFTWHADSTNPRKIYFTNTSISPTAAATVLWTFGDGTSATTWHAVHEYAQPGRYLVCLRIQSGPNCVRTTCDSVTVAPPQVNCIQQSNFSFVRSATNSQLVQFTPAHINNDWQYTWTFGDGTGSQNQVVSHLYAQPATYTACLTVFRNVNCASTTCKPVVTLPTVNCNNVSVFYNYYRDSLYPNKIYFQAISNVGLASQRWTITRLPSLAGTAPIVLNQNNPTYTFQDTGYYRVCLRAVTSSGCVKEYCQEIYIGQVNTPTNCSLQVFPNPASGVANINVYLNQGQMIHAYVYNSMNVLVTQKHQQGSSGNNLVSIPIANLVAGTYTVRVIYGNSVCYAQFVKI